MAAYISESERGEREEAKKILEKQILVERELIELYDKSAKESSNTVVQKILGTISCDSQKHILMLSAVLSFLADTELFKEDRANLAESLKPQLELEAESVKAGERLLGYDWLKDRAGYRAIIDSWVSDERRHHEFLKRLSERSFIPISPNDWSGIFRDEDFIENRYKVSKAFQRRVSLNKQGE